MNLIIDIDTFVDIPTNTLTIHTRIKASIDKTLSEIVKPSTELKTHLFLYRKPLS